MIISLTACTATGFGTAGYTHFLGAGTAGFDTSATGLIAALLSQWTFVVSAFGSTKFHGTNAAARGNTSSTRLVAALFSFITDIRTTVRAAKLLGTDTSWFGTFSTAFVAALEARSANTGATLVAGSGGTGPTGSDTGPTTFVAKIME